MGGSTGGFPVELILFGMIAAFLVLRLRSILGRRQGFERPPAEPRPGNVSGNVSGNVVDLRANPARPAQAPAQRPAGPVIDGVAEPVSAARALPTPASPAGQALATMARLEPAFSPQRFLDGAEAAFGLIVQAFAVGDRAALRPLLSDDTYAAFDGAISGRETAHETQRTEIRSVNSLAIESAELLGNNASIGVRFVTDQVNVTLGPDGLPVAGADAVTEMTDVWTFERTLGSPDPAWRLAAARSA